MAIAQAEIFFSYAWGGEKEDYALALYDALQAAGHKVVMDRHEVQYRESFTQFMQRIGRGAFIIVVVSDKYLRSPYCMFELLEIYRKSNSELGDMAAKVFPVVMGDADIRNDKGSSGYASYWRQQFNELEQQMITQGLRDMLEFKDKLAKYDEIATNFIRFANWLQDIKVPPPDKLAENGFAIIKTAIAEQIAKATTENNDSATGKTIIINNNNTKIGQQNIDSSVNNSGTNFNL